MACNRGCVGTSINNATNVCGVQISHNCSPGCAGLASGQSRVQVNAAGQLVLCSNVGGTCECNAMPTGEDSFTNNGDGTVTHTSVGGTPSTVNICDLVADGGCTDALVNNGDGTYTHTGIDGTQTIIDICSGLSVLDTNCIDLTLTDVAAGCQLQADIIVDPDPCNAVECRANGLYVENDFRAAFGNGENAINAVANPGTLPVANTLVDEEEFTITNPSDCHDMVITLTVSGYDALAANQSGNQTLVWVDHLVFVDGIPLPSNATDLFFPLQPAGVLGSTLENASGGFVGTYTIGPGVTSTIRSERYVENPDGLFFGDFILSAAVLSANGTALPT